MLTQEDRKALRERMREEVSASESRIMTYIKSHVEAEFHQIADGHGMLAEKMDRMEQKIDVLDEKVSSLQGEVTAQEFVLTRLQKAQ